MAYSQTKSVLKKEGLAPKKKLGQNFLVHEHTAKRIVSSARLELTDTVIEVGVGLGALTRPLAKAAGRVIGLEADSGIVRLHQEQKDLPENVEVRHSDVLKTDLRQLSKEIGSRLKIVANLPYSISSPFLFRLMDSADCIDYAVVMLQKEVADRLHAEPGTKTYGAPTVLLASYATVTPLLLIKPAEFHPRPKVDSLVIRISFNPVPPRVEELGTFNRKLFRRIVNGAFGQRRKTLVNALAGSLHEVDKQQLSTTIQEASLSPGIRAEKLTLEDYVHLTRAMEPLFSS